MAWDAHSQVNSGTVVPIRSTAAGVSRRARPVVQAAAAALLAMTVSACDPPTLESLDLPAPSIGSDAYAVTAKFANALNLPDMAKVRLKGADIGEVESIEAIDDVAVVKLRILRGVRLPVGSTAQLRSATPLGDVFVALEPPIQPSAELLKDGDVLDLQTTSSAASVEGVLSSAAVLVNGGVVRNLTHLVNGLGKASADHGQTLGDIVGQSNQLLDTLNKRSAQIQNSLDKTSQLAASISSREKTINDLIAASGPGVQAIDANQIGDLANKSGQISDQLAKFPSIQGTDGRSTLADLNSISRGFNDIAVSPDTSLVALNRLIPMLIKANAGSAQAHDVNIAKLALGNIDDAGYKGSSDYHGPKQADWAYFVGSFKYTLYRLQERIVGQGPNPPAPQDSLVPPGR
ncbi:MCE family protein [Mycobacteroides chelonae]|nr:MCE family protein [Mycobacteroides chelonae]QQG94800.1 MCE family protein [Mycobacteroides chelonae]